MLVKSAEFADILHDYYKWVTKTHNNMSVKALNRTLVFRLQFYKGGYNSIIDPIVNVFATLI